MIWTALILAAALGSALVAGVFYAFSSFVMPALGRLPAADGIAAMQAINITAVMPGFLSGFMGTAVLCLIVLVGALLGHGGGWAVAGALLYLIGTLGVTMVANVPRNNLLAALDPAVPEAAAAWASYQSGWNLWNHVRGIAGLAGAGALIVSLL